ncbi:helix-turn-helix transcriptional regulator [Pedobacter sp.]|jgi:AraC-like DNA-binding protein|uniref:helix-turn-helix domain-containing protein n=1 Tax=Pedobacter sp. TaxID=1411316 RepID=UPI002D0EAF78|nr:helix-turn-helix transcriptional regulator [Pedobacter sp.]HWW38064.1 helix-turn-helix transcriptional regulator [Pedobacter sp.]
MLQETNTYTERFRLFDLDYWPPAFKRLKVLQSLIELDFRYNRDISVYAVKMDTSIHALNRFAKAYLGRSVYELLQDRIYREALYLLQYTKHTVKEISELLGFSDLPYFSRWFKQRNGQTAKVYRKGLGG